MDVLSEQIDEYYKIEVKGEDSVDLSSESEGARTLKSGRETKKPQRLVKKKVYIDCLTGLIEKPNEVVAVT